MPQVDRRVLRVGALAVVVGGRAGVLLAREQQGGAAREVGDRERCLVSESGSLAEVEALEGRMPEVVVIGDGAVVAASVHVTLERFAGVDEHRDTRRGPWWR